MNRNKPVTKLAVVDIETLDKTPSAVIFAIGCVIVDIEQPALSNHFYTVVNPKQKGRTAGNGTPEWWLKQSVESPDAFKELQAAYGSNKTLKSALYEFGVFLTNDFGDEPINMFGNGPEFDNVILDDAFAWAGLKTPWPYWGNQSIRTSNLLMQIAGVKVDREFTGVKHHALDDAHHEAKLLIDALKCFKPVNKNFVYVAPNNQIADEFMNHHIAPAKQNLDEWAYHDPEIKNNIDKIRAKLNSDKFKAAGASAEQAVKKLNDAFSKGIKIDKVGEGVLYAMLGSEVVKTLDGIFSGWRKEGQDINKSAVDKINQMAMAIEMCDLEKHSGEYQAAHLYMDAIFSKLRSHDVDVKTYRQCANALDKLLFERQSLTEKARCFDELQAILRKANPDSFERECASSLLDDCKHAIKELSAYKSEYMQSAHK